MNLLRKSDLQNLISSKDKLKISMYIPLHLPDSGVDEDKLRFKNMLKEAEKTAKELDVSYKELNLIFDKLRILLDDTMFWVQQNQGLAIFVSESIQKFYRLPFRFKEFVSVSDRFHLKPLLSIFTNDYQFYILGLSQNNVELFHCGFKYINKVNLEGLPTSLAEALKYDVVEKHVQYHSGDRDRGPGQTAPVYHGQGLEEDRDKNIKRYFRKVNKGLHDYFHDDRTPLILAGVEYLHPIYREVNTYPNLKKKGIPGNPENLTKDELHQSALAIIRLDLVKEKKQAIDRFFEADSVGLTSIDPEEIIKRAVDGRIDTLFTALGNHLWGIYHEPERIVEFHKARQTGDEDLLDLAAVHTMLKGGKVYVVKPGLVPVSNKISAIYRY